MKHNRHYFLLKKRDIRIAASVFLSGLSCFGLLYYYQALLPSLSAYFNINQAESSFAISSATFGLATGLIISMFVADRYNRKHVIGFSLFGSAILAFMTSFQEIFIVLVVLNFFKGLLLAGTTAVCMAYIAEEVSEIRKIQITGFYIAGNAIGGMLGRVLAADMVHYYSWQIASEMIGVICFVFAILFVVFSPKSRYFRPKKTSFYTLIKPNIKMAFDRQLLPYYITGFLLLGGFVSLYNYMAFFMINPPFSIPKKWMSYVYFLYITGVFGSMSVFFWEKYFPKPQHILKLMSIIGIVGIGFLFLEHIFFVVIGIGIFTYSFFTAHTVCSKMVGSFSKEKKSVAIAFYLLAYYMGSSILGSVTGVVLSKLNWEIFLILLMFIIGIIFILFSLRHR